MVKKIMRSDPKQFSTMQNQNNFCVKIAVSFLCLGLAFRLLLSDSFSFSSSSSSSMVMEETPPPMAEEKTEKKTESPVFHLPLEASSDSVDFSSNNNNKSQSSQNEKCDLFVGEWVADKSGPMYTNESCNLIEHHQNCMKNGRPDSGYLYWRWSPRGCELPKFNPRKFLDFMRNKSFSFIGDSISRNHVQSLLCILSQVESAVEIYHDKEYRSKIWKFPSHNFTLSVIWTPFLIKATIFEDMDGVSSSETQLHLDTLDTLWTKQYETFDFVLIGGGKWFLKTAIYHENNTIVGCHYCPGKNLTDFGFDYAYRKAIGLVLDFFVKSSHKATIFFRTTTPDHFENGEWFSGGYCNRTVPFKEGQIEMIDVDSTMRGIELEEFAKATSLGSDRAAKLKLLDTTFLSLLRPDGHPGPYRQYQPFAKDKNANVQNDCLHWCLPGPIDSWNDIIMEMLVNP
ncbi:protein trichome birefringence-like 25 isoform X2 [Arachis hypogaea]|uniref:protein trichome birefringence-like 25 isoform X2 n=1 Tax=Arachis hypogaea TaxID=3818 RepID=UPI003B221BFC